MVREILGFGVWEFSLISQIGSTTFGEISIAVLGTECVGAPN